MADVARPDRSKASGVAGVRPEGSRWARRDTPVEISAGVPAYRPRVSLLWWVHKPAYLLFVLRELSSVFVAWFVVVTLFFAWSVGQGEEQYGRFLELAANPLVVVVNLAALAFLLLHTVTWFKLTPQAMPLRVPKAMPGGYGGRRVPAVAVVAAQWAGFVVVSALVVWLVVD
jgi:fumarate reductase subunit C